MRSEQRILLNLGCGPQYAGGIPSVFRSPEWRELRVDIDNLARPDLLASATDLGKIGSMTIDAVWSSHTLEHLSDHEVPHALREVYRVLQPEGVALLKMPDLQAVAQLVVDGKAETVAYVSAAGPITALDMLYGHRGAIESGNVFMRHHTGFTRERLGRLLLEAGFAKAIVSRVGFDLWAVGLMPRAAPDFVERVAGAVPSE